RPLSDDADTHPGPGADVEFVPSVEEPPIAALNLPELLALRADEKRAPAQSQVEGQDRAALVADEAADARGEPELEPLSPFAVPADETRGGPDRLVVVAELDVDGSVVGGGVEDPEVLLTRREVPEERRPQRPGLVAGWFGTRRFPGDRRRREQEGQR